MAGRKAPRAEAAGPVRAVPGARTVDHLALRAGEGAVDLTGAHALRQCPGLRSGRQLTAQSHEITPRSPLPGGGKPDLRPQ